ncbi:MAG: hypothetical protein IKW67_02875 [Alphaproteobacteria bacterium]|nr:hypothetical protein [Alphaproteobacteria bacterium]
MQNERENLYQSLTYVDYDIGGNVFRAYYDADKKIVFVVDYLETDVKPNVLLVINPDGNRKWDDILMNDYGVDLETVRPKKDNKYQKLDIEYAGLAQYDALVRAYENGDDLNAELADLNAFRHDAAMRAANERLGDAGLTIERSRETIEKTTQTISELQTRLKVLRAKLAELRRGIGREPTKQSAAKILKTEAQIDTTTEKLARAKKRLLSAQQRLDNATEEEQVAREILERLGKQENLPARPIVTAAAVVDVPEVPAVIEKNKTDIIPFETESEPGVEGMADEEVKPLFDKNPNILDDEIAFKPIRFDDSDVSDEVGKDDEEYKDVVEIPENIGSVIQPLSFTPPVSMVPIAEESDQEFQEMPIARPVLDTIAPITENDDVPVKIDSELLGGWDVPEIEVPAPAPIVEPVPTLGISDVKGVEDAPVIAEENIDEEETVDVHAPVVSSLPTERPDVVIAPISSGFRPVSPIAGDVPAVADNSNVVRQKPNVLYYIMLVVLIVLSVFALWLYQNSVNDNTPALISNTTTEAEDFVETKTVDVAPAVQSVEEVAEIPFVGVVETVSVAEPEPVIDVVPDVMPEPVIDQDKTETVVDVSVTETVPVIEEPVVEDANVVPAVVAEPTVAPVVVSEEEIIASKPAYNVSQNEKMFVADDEYVVAEPTAAKPIAMVDPNVDYDEPTVVAPQEEYVDVQEVVYDTCSDGNPPDENGCCAGENLMNVGGGVYQCCAESTGECFDPMQ